MRHLNVATENSEDEEAEEEAEASSDSHYRRIPPFRETLLGNARHSGKDSMEASGGEVDRLLRLAEELQTNIDISERRAAVASGAAFVVTVAIALMAFNLIENVLRTHAVPEQVVLYAGGAVGIVVAYFILRVSLRVKKAFTKTQERDRRALTAVVNLLWQLARTRQTHRRSPLARAEFKIRVSRFDIGSETSLSNSVLQEMEVDSMTDLLKERDSPDEAAPHPRG